MASTKSKRARRRNRSATPPRAVASTRREQREQRVAEIDQQRRRSARQLGSEGPRPRGLFGPVPVSEVAILAGLVAAVIGFARSSTVPLVAGLIICGLGVMEVTGREHFSGYRSHSALLASVPSVGLEAGIVFAFGDPGQRAWLLVIVVPVFGVLFWALRHRFMIARQARLARAARGTAPN